jgi:iron complex outermembrane recepter protein
MEIRLLRLVRWIPLLVALPVAAAPDAGPTIDIADMSIEDLANLQITSVSKKPERLAGAAASVFVITADDIRRSGAFSIPEVLRLAPNLQVAQINGQTYAITARGLNGSNNTGPNKLLVMIDGRSVYLPLFSGVLWEALDVMLEDVARIEVISGPGGTLWGVNAVNGVINITTRRQLAVAARRHPRRPLRFSPGRRQRRLGLARVRQVPGPAPYRIRKRAARQ